MCVFAFFKLRKWYQIAKSVSYVLCVFSIFICNFWCIYFEWKLETILKDNLLGNLSQILHSTLSWHIPAIALHYHINKDLLGIKRGEYRLKSVWASSITENVNFNYVIMTTNLLHYTIDHEISTILWDLVVLDLSFPILWMWLWMWLFNYILIR